MTRSLPAAPNMEHLKKQAKDLQKSHRNKKHECCEILRLLRQLENKSDREVLEYKLSLNEIQLALALDYGFKSWGDLKKHVLNRQDNLKFLHIHCGDYSARILNNSSVPGDNLVWREIYIEGPVPGNHPDEQFRRTRAEFLAGNLNMDSEYILQGSNARYQALVEAGKYEEVVLWFDACMFDQTIMVHLIDQCAKQQWPDTRLSLICIGKFPDMDKFFGLGQLNSSQLVSLFDQRHEISPEEVNLSEAAWKAFTAADPAGIEELVKGDCSALPYLKNALIRHLEQYPSVGNGLNRTQNQIMRAVSGGCSMLKDIFVESTNEQPAFMGDTSLWICIDELAECRYPLLKLHGPCSLKAAMEQDSSGNPQVKDISKWEVSVTETGKDVFSGRQDFIKLNGIEHWLGGVHLHGEEAQWRWDEKEQKLIRLF